MKLEISLAAAALVLSGSLCGANALAGFDGNEATSDNAITRNILSFMESVRGQKKQAASISMNTAAPCHLSPAQAKAEALDKILLALLKAAEGNCNWVSVEGEAVLCEAGIAQFTSITAQKSIKGTAFTSVSGDVMGTWYSPLVYKPMVGAAKSPQELRDSGALVTHEELKARMEALRSSIVEEIRQKKEDAAMKKLRDEVAQK